MDIAYVHALIRVSYEGDALGFPTRSGMEGLRSISMA